jgi:branched-chain amino acid transport system permease protein
VPKRIGVLLAALLGGFLLVVLGAGTATAADSINITGTIKTPTGDPAPGIKVDVSGPESFTGTATTDTKGEWKVPITASGSYTVKVDEATLPDGLHVQGDSEITRLVFGSKDIKVSFTLTTGPGGDTPGPAADTESLWSQAVGLAVDGLVFGLVLALGSVGLSLIYGTTGLVNFAHGELLTFGALSAYFFNNLVGLPFVVSAILAVIVTAALGGTLQDRLLWRPLRRRGTGLIAMLVVSIGLGIALRYLFLFILTGWSFGGATSPYAEFGGQPGLEFGPISVTPKALIGSAVAIVLILAVAYFLLRTQMGRASRAVSDNPALASASGINVERVINVVWTLGAGLAAVGGVIYSLTVGVNWQEGQNLLLLIFAAVTLGGLGTAFGAVAGSIVLGVFLQVSTLIIPSELKNAGALAVLIVVLLVRPQGILGRRERVG